MGGETTIFQDMKHVLQETAKKLEEKPASLLVVGGEHGGKLFDLIGDNISIGRNPDNTIFLEAKGVSRYHTKIIFQKNEWMLEDANSRNGTYLNDKKIQGAFTLKKEDIIKIGDMAFKYIPPGDPERLSYEKLQWKANRDQHTGCYNKSYFNNAIDLNIKKTKFLKHPLSLMIIDLDHFKKLNDNYGHDAGDYVLKEMAQFVQEKIVRPNDLFARYGGEEFVLLLPNTPLAQAKDMAEKMRKGLEAHNFFYEDKKLTVTASIGLASLAQEDQSGKGLFKKADNAVYKAKSLGRNNVQVFSKDD